VAQLKCSMPVAKLVEAERLKIVGAQYNLDCGTVVMVA